MQGMRRSQDRKYSPEAEAAIRELAAAIMDAEPDHAKRMEFLKEVNAAFDALRAESVQPPPL